MSETTDRLTDVKNEIVAYTFLKLKLHKYSYLFSMGVFLAQLAAWFDARNWPQLAFLPLPRDEYIAKNLKLFCSYHQKFS